MRKVIGLSVLALGLAACQPQQEAKKDEPKKDEPKKDDTKKDDTKILEDRMRRLPGLQDVTSDLQVRNPQVNVKLNRDRIGRTGVNSRLAIPPAAFTPAPQMIPTPQPRSVPARIGAMEAEGVILRPTTTHTGRRYASGSASPREP